MNRKPHNRPGNLLLFLGLLFLAETAFAEPAWQLSAAEWSRPRSGLAVQQMAPVANAVRAWQAAVESGATNARLQLVHASGEEGSLWAAELRDWLIALAVPPAVIEIVPGGLPPDRLELRLVDAAPAGEDSA